MRIAIILYRLGSCAGHTTSSVIYLHSQEHSKIVHAHTCSERARKKAFTKAMSRCQMKRKQPQSPGDCAPKAEHFSAYQISPIFFSGLGAKDFLEWAGWVELPVYTGSITTA